MRRLIHSALVAACVGSSVPVGVAQSDDPPPMRPPVQPQWEDERPARGITAGLVVPIAQGPAGEPSAVDRVPPPAVPKLPPAVGVPAAVPPPVATSEPLGSSAVPSFPTFSPPPSAGEPLPRPSAFASADRPPVPTAPPHRAEMPPAPQPTENILRNARATPPAEGVGENAPAEKASGTAAQPAFPPLPTAAAAEASQPPIPTTTEAAYDVRPEILTAEPLRESIPTAAGMTAAETGFATPAHLGEVLCDPIRRLFPQQGPVRLRGWINSGGVYNSSVPDSKFNGPYAIVDRSAEPMLNQLYVILDRPLPTSGRFGAGFRVDTLFGSDFYLGQSRGFEVDRDFGLRWNGQYYGLAIPQAYGEFGDDVISLKLGRFYTTVGYEMLPAVGNFFYSRAYSFQFGQPITHWGGLLTTQLTRHWNVHVGLVNGWDTLVGRANNINFLGGLKYQATDWWWTSFALVSGQEQNNVANLPNIPGTDGNRTRYSFLFGLLPGGACGKWEYVFHHYYGFQENGTPQGNFARWYGIDQYLYYRVSQSLRAGLRFEWFRDEDGTRVGLNRPANPNKPPLPGNFFSLTTGVNYTPTANFMVRPEIRWDFTTDSARPAFNDGQKNYQLMLGCDMIWQF